MRHTFESRISTHIIGLIRQKQADGFNYTVEEYHLKKLDEFYISAFPDETSVTRDIAAKWAQLRPTEGVNYRNRRVSVLRQLSLYILSLGLDAYVPRNNGAVAKTVLYIPSRDEMTAFFEKLDSWEARGHCGCRTVHEYKMLFRLYYCCGLRLSEARLLKKEDADFYRGILTIYKSKGHKDRRVYLPADGKQMLADYAGYIEKVAPLSPWLFPGQDISKPLSASAIQHRFIDCWNTLPVQTDKRPSPHCLRHAFVVERMNEWMLQGLNTQELLPYLSRHLGHKSPSETFYYYHLVSNAFAVIKDKDIVSRRVIPEVFEYEDF
jgi:integrase